MLWLYFGFPSSFAKSRCCLWVWNKCRHFNPSTNTPSPLGKPSHDFWVVHTAMVSWYWLCLINRINRPPLFLYAFQPEGYLLSQSVISLFCNKLCYHTLNQSNQKKLSLTDPHTDKTDYGQQNPTQRGSFTFVIMRKLILASTLVKWVSIEE